MKRILEIALLLTLDSGAVNRQTNSTKPKANLGIVVDSNCDKNSLYKYA